MSRLAPIIIVSAIVGAPAGAGWRDQEIDGSSARAFEQSVALLLSELPRRRREEVEIALAIIWIGNTIDGGDSDQDEDVDPDGVRVLSDFAEGLLTEIKRGEVLSAIEKREEEGSDYTAAEYIKQLDGLQFDDIKKLGERYGSEPDLKPLQQALWCERRRRSSIDLLVTRRAARQWCDGVY